MKSDIDKFLANLLDKDYSKANEALESVIEKKLTQRIKESAKTISSNEWIKQKKDIKKNK
jgi:hypothetical protein